jgi:hypothetical protein
MRTLDNTNFWSPNKLNKGDPYTNENIYRSLSLYDSLIREVVFLSMLPTSSLLICQTNFLYIVFFKLKETWGVIRIVHQCCLVFIFFFISNASISLNGCCSAPLMQRVHWYVNVDPTCEAQTSFLHSIFFCTLLYKLLSPLTWFNNDDKAMLH